MRRRRIVGIAACAALLIVGAVLAAQRMDAAACSFDGSRVCNSDMYLLEFSQMNRDDGHSLELDAGDVLRVEYAIERGRVDVRVEAGDSGMIYRGDRVESGSFELPAVRAGAYAVSVHAENAAGRLCFSVEKGS